MRTIKFVVEVRVPEGVGLRTARTDFQQHHLGRKTSAYEITKVTRAYGQVYRPVTEKV